MWYLNEKCSEEGIRSVDTTEEFLRGCCITRKEAHQQQKNHSFLLLPEKLPQWALEGDR
jgi:hypothetical protein